MSETSPSPASIAPASTAPANPSAFACLLPHRAVIAVSGREAGHFLHNLLTASIEGLEPGQGVPAALLTPQGKIITDMLVFNASDDEPLYLIDTPTVMSEELARKLQMYRLRSDVTITVVSGDIVVAAVSGIDTRADDHVYVFADPRDSRLGLRLIGPVADVQALLPADIPHEESRFHAMRISLGHAECGKDYLPVSTFPHEANLDQVGAIDFRKGCYIGQEVVSRMEHRNTGRTRTLIAVLQDGINVLGGAECRAGDVVLGQCGECYGGKTLVMIRLDKFETAKKSMIDVTVGGVFCRFFKPEYAKFDFSGNEILSS